MYRVVLSLFAVVGVGCTESSVSIPDPVPSVTPAPSPNPRTKHSEATLGSHSIESGKPNADAILYGLEKATKKLGDVLCDSKYALAEGTIAGRFHLDARGTVMKFVVDKSVTLVQNVDTGALTSAFVHAAFDPRYSFPAIDDDAIVYATFEIVSHRE